ncbi:MAG: undecaprenyl-diphosphate phosphatase [Dethiobacter sp.]|jgi:undecaprenyl-diphosphatase|nr:MAG: undecaprenyl-diphosphate phosphatase [Dethiobacter sp.]
MNYLEAILLGLLQGLTEFLPVSSSGHLVLAQSFLNIKQPGVTFEVMVHFGTLMSIIRVFRKDLCSLFRSFKSKMEERKFLVLLIIGSIPTGLMGILLQSFFIGIFDKPLIVGFMLLITGFIVLAISRVNINTKTIKNMNIWDAVVIGIFQGIAIIPGITRSGSTILGALCRGLNRDTAIRYSFLLALPAIAGATILELRNLLKFVESPEFFFPNVLAMLTAFFSGILAITVFINLLKRGKFHYIAYYCWFLGILTVLYSFS